MVFLKESLTKELLMPYCEVFEHAHANQRRGNFFRNQNYHVRKVFMKYVDTGATGKDFCFYMLMDDRIEREIIFQVFGLST